MCIIQMNQIEVVVLAAGICPDCGSSNFHKGPCGGLAFNVECVKCGSRFNICWPFDPERI